jgi:predicted nucleic acid-binding protein
VIQHTILLDTSFIVTLENKSDSHHERAKTLERERKVTEALTADIHFRQAGLIPLLLDPE